MHETINLCHSLDTPLVTASLSGGRLRLLPEKLAEGLVDWKVFVRSVEFAEVIRLEEWPGG